jgi:hypothetical protein
MKAARQTVETIMTIFGPYLSAAHPLICRRQPDYQVCEGIPTRRPMIPPADAPLLSPDCHGAGIAYPMALLVVGTPKRRRKAAIQSFTYLHLAVGNLR